MRHNGVSYGPRTIDIGNLDLSIGKVINKREIPLYADTINTMVITGIKAGDEGKYLKTLCARYSIEYTIALDILTSEIEVTIEATNEDLSRLSNAIYNMVEYEQRKGNIMDIAIDGDKVIDEVW